MTEINFTPHRQLSIEQLNGIIACKSVAWKYTNEQHKEWIDENISDDDLHIILLKDNKVLAYLNLIGIEIKINKKKYAAFGIGNVCAAEEGQGFGKILMNETNNYLKNLNKIGLLFCKKALIDYYAKFKWENIDSSFINEKTLSENQHLMIYNFNNKIVEFSFNGKQF